MAIPIMAITFHETKHIAGGKIQLALTFFCNGTEFAKGTAHLDGKTLYLDYLTTTMDRVDGLSSTAQALFALAKKYRDVQTSPSVAKQLVLRPGR